MRNFFYSRILPTVLYALAIVLIGGMPSPGPHYEPVFVAESVAFPDGRHVAASETTQGGGERIVIPAGSLIAGHVELRARPAN